MKEYKFPGFYVGIDEEAAEMVKRVREEYKKRKISFSAFMRICIRKELQIKSPPKP